VEARTLATEINQLLDQRLTEATAARSLDELGPQLARDPKRMGSVLGGQDAQALREWATKQASNPNATDEMKAAVRSIDQLLAQREQEKLAAPLMDEIGPKLTRDPAKLLQLVQNADQYATGPEIQQLRQWAMARASRPGATDRDRQLAQEVSRLIEKRTQEAIAARKLDSIGPPSMPPDGGPGVIRKGLEMVPGYGQMLRIDRTLRDRTGAAADVPNLQEQARLIQHLESVLKLDKNNKYAKEALERIFLKPSTAYQLQGGAMPPAADEGRERIRELRGR
jgi:hypothetical protein